MGVLRGKSAGCATLVACKRPNSTHRRTHSNWSSNHISEHVIQPTGSAFLQVLFLRPFTSPHPHVTLCHARCDVFLYMHTNSIITVCSEYSKTLNDARLKVLAARETAIQSVVKEARARVRDLARNPTSYKKLLQDLIVQVGAGRCCRQPVVGRWCSAAVKHTSADVAVQHQGWLCHPLA